MRLVTDSQIAEIRAGLAERQGSDDLPLATASVRIDLDPFDFARTGAALVDRAVAFSGPDGERIAGLGTAWRAQADGEGRFTDLRDRLGELPAGVKAFLGFSFSPSRREEAGNSMWEGYASAELFVPRISIEGAEGGSTIRVAVPRGEDSEPTLGLLGSMRQPEWRPVVDIGGHATEPLPPVSEWADRVDDALTLIGEHRIDKVVLARSVVVRSDTPPAILGMFRSLVRSYPQCYNFAWKSGDAVFMGASPELLASVAGERLVSNPLAGSAQRGEGSVRDEEIGKALLDSDKDRREHALVVEDMVTGLDAVATDLRWASTPSVKKMASVQHLSTRIEGAVPEPTSVLDVVAALHPTPAVGGSPTAAALGIIEDLESIDRGWYTGGIGWVDSSGDGTVALALRCGLIRGLTTHLFAGAGIVEGSRPEAELMETRLKLEPLMRLLTAT